MAERKARKADGGMAGGSFAGLSGPKPPPALSSSVLGMKKGGKVCKPTVLPSPLRVETACAAPCDLASMAR